MVWCTITTNDDDDRIKASTSLETLTSREWLLQRLASFLWPCWNIIVILEIRLNVREVICLCRLFLLNWSNSRLWECANEEEERSFFPLLSILFLPPALGESWFNCSMEFARSSYRLAIRSSVSRNRCGTNRVISWSFVRNWQILDTLHSLRCQQFRTLCSVRKFWGERSKSRKFYTFNAHVQRYFPYADEGVHVSKTSVLSALLLIGWIAYFLTWCFFVSRMCSADPLKIKLLGREGAIDKEDVM